MVEEIITALSRIRWLFVIARNSSFTYKGQAIDVKQVGRELGVRYVLEGSVRKAGGRVRTNRTPSSSWTLISPGGSRWTNRSKPWPQTPFSRMVLVFLSPVRRKRALGAAVMRGDRM